MAKPSKKMLLLDAMALIYRAYYGVGDNFFFNSKGLNTTAMNLFSSSLHRFITKEQPTHVAVAFDTHAPTLRNKMVDDYKAGRQEIPEDIINSIPWIKKILEGFRIPVLELDGYEADDIIGTLAKQAAKEDFLVYMITPDKDYGQLVEENIFMYKPPFRGKAEEIYGVPEILAKWDIERIDQVIDMLGLMGDKVDNIPGIPGVGEKTACKLLKQFGNIENLLENTDQLKGKLKEKIETNADMARMSKQLATIILDVPVKYNFDDFKLEEPDKEILSPIFAELEFRTLGQRILGEGYNVNLTKSKSGQPTLFDQPNDNSTVIEAEIKPAGKTIKDVEHDYILVNSDKAIDDLLKHLNKKTLICFDTETTGVDANEAELVGLSFATEAFKAYYVPIDSNAEKAKATVAKFKPLFENEKIAKVAQNIKYDVLMLKWYDVEVKGTLEDTMLAHYLLEPEMRHKMDLLAETYLNYTPVAIEELIGKKGKKQGTMRDVPVEQVTEYAAEDADITLQLFHYLKPKIEAQKLSSLYNDVEMALVPALVEMEYNGFLIDKDFLSDYSVILTKDILSLKQKVFEQVGAEFNLDSPKQLGTMLFDKMEIPYKGKKTKTGQYSTNEETLLKLAEEHSIVNDILEYRTSNKLKSTYVDALPTLINPKTGRIHSSFNQAVAATGRLSSNNPNLQNIPIRTEKGRKVREAFVPRNDDFTILCADYSQVELRIIAALSKDEAMIQAFKDGIDIHSVTASKVYKVSVDEVTGDMRRNAKTVNFGIIYGISAYGLSQRLKIPRKEAQTLIDEYFAEYPFIKKYMDDMKTFAKTNGYVETLLGRPRRLKDINSKNATVRGFAERNAINSPIQGTAADLIKVAMIKIHKAMQQKQMQSKLILQVHDELVFDAYKTELEELRALVIDNMSSAMDIAVPLVVDSGTGDNWLQAH